MSYLVLARKYRPQAFSTIIGQEHISRALANTIIRNRIPHALLLTGPRGVGKTTSARVFARALNCQKRPEFQELQKLSEEEARAGVEPCGECVNCTEIARSASLAVWEIDGASNNSVDNVRELIESLRSQPPFGSRFKIYIIDEVHMLSTAAFNALLKSLEEPPPNTVFIFATTDPQKIPETVVSRCQRFDFRRLASDRVSEQLRSIAGQEGGEIADEVFRLIAEKSQGGMRDAQSMLDRLLSVSHEKISLEDAERLFGFVDRSVFYRIADAVFEQKPTQCFLILDRIFAQSLDLRAFAGDFLKFWRDLLVLSFGSQSEDRSVRETLGFPPEEYPQLLERVARSNSFDLQRLFDLAQKTAEGAIASNYPRYVFEAGLAKMSTLSSLRPLAEIVAALESGGGIGGGGASGGGGTRSGAQPSSVPGARAAVNPALREGGAEHGESPSEGATALPSPQSIRQHSVGSGENSSHKKVELNWLQFVNAVKEQGEPVLAAFLRRVTPRHFTPGKVELEAQSFDLVSLKEPASVESLKRCLSVFSGHSSWEILFVTQGAAKREAAPLRTQSTGISGAEEKKDGVKPSLPEKERSERRGDKTKAEPGSEHREGRDRSLPGSIVALEVEAEKKLREKVQQEVREDPLIQRALEAFGGGRIEKVSVLKAVQKG